MTHYNLALIPTDKTLSATCIGLAQANMQEIASQYLLGEKARPHVTLCQYVTELSPDDVWSKMSEYRAKKTFLRFDHIYVRAGTGRHEGFYWVGLAVQNNSTILSGLQRDVSNKLTEPGITRLTESSTYFPHLTWARCFTDRSITIATLPDPNFWLSEYEFQLSIGLSDENGVYQSCLKTE